MHEPESYGLSETQTLMQVADPTPPPGFAQFWSEWTARVWTQDPHFEPVADSGLSAIDAGAAGLTHTFRSLKDVRVGCRIAAPPDGAAPRAVVITSHGYGMDPRTPLTDPHIWDPAAIAVVQIRFRGYPGSQMDTGDLTAQPGGYIAIGLHSRTDWILNLALADIVNAVRAARRMFGERTPVMLHGESFGGGVAVLAASVLSGRIPVARLAMGLPSLGWWRWRLERPALAGIGLDVRRAIEAARGMESDLMETLRLFDAVVHARRILAPALCKVAMRDDVVPAPTAAAIYNALGTAPGMKWRFVTRYGHHDGGLSDLRRHVLFERLAGLFLDPAQDVAALMHRWETLLTAGERGPD
ncbi:MAG: acetylxylan esterase [Planctomycetota bacterium]|nr:acetylxylan esterase [Planctomycetota bacterium]